jgi:Response regulator containing a CheY-like receiver domain and an HTH DNA-binding domain
LSKIILVAEPYERLRQQLRVAFTNDPSVDKVYEVSTSDALRRELAYGRGDFIIIQQTLLEDVKHLLSQKQVLVLGSKLDERILREAYMHGALGYLLESAPYECFIAGLHLKVGQFLLDPTLIATALQTTFIDQKKQELSILTAREQEVLALLKEGASNRIIANQLCISTTTVKTHVTHIYEKLKLEGRKSHFK